MKFTKILTVFSFVAALGFGVAQPGLVDVAYAADTVQSCNAKTPSMNFDSATGKCVAKTVVPNSAFTDKDVLKTDDVTKDPNGTSAVSTINERVITLAKAFAGIVLAIAVFFIVYAGYKYVVSQGDSKQTEAAKMMIVSAFIGLFISLAAFVILNFFTGVITG
jgi:hypothetical protein